MAPATRQHCWAIESRKVDIPTPGFEVEDLLRGGMGSCFHLDLRIASPFWEVRTRLDQRPPANSDSSPAPGRSPAPMFALGPVLDQTLELERLARAPAHLDLKRWIAQS